jgi:carbamate kinase
MSITKVVIALGGNALQEAGTPPTAEAQFEVVKKTAGYLAEISSKGYEMAIVHGNGPQVGRIVLGQEIASRENSQTPAMPFDVCGAMSQGYIGYHIQQALRDALRNRNRNVPVVTIATQVVVDPNDPAFKNPTKPIGPFYTEEEARRIEEEKGFKMKEDAGRGWRRVVPSPDPKKIVELSAIKRLWDTTIVITAGGGGIPVIENMDGSLTGVAAVIDKDLAAERLKVCLDFKKPGQRFLDHMTVPEAIRYMEEGHFAPGSMLPKVMAAIKFARTFPGRQAIITSLYKAVDALEGKEGTVVTMA